MNRPRRRMAFTLVEMLLVIVIITILMSLAVAGVMKVMERIPEVRTRTEIAQLDAALAAFMGDYNLSDPPPSLLVLREDLAYNPASALEMQSYNFLNRVFGKNLGPTDWNGNGTIDVGVPLILEGEQCLVFYLGGIPSGNVPGGSPACQGFSTNTANPAMPGGKRNGPYMNFQASRLVLGSAVNPAFQGSPWFFVYLDGWNAKPKPIPYAYFSSSGITNQYNPFTSTGGGDCASIGARPYYFGISATGVVNYVNPNRYQIISAGKNALFGGGQWEGGAAAGVGADDQANFSTRLLGAEAQ